MLPLLRALGKETLYESAMIRSSLPPVQEPDTDVVVEQNVAPPPAYQLLDGGANESWLVACEPPADLSLTKSFESLVTLSVIDRNLTPGETPMCSETITSTRFEEVALLALQNIFFLIRIAKWKVDFLKEQRFDRDEALPYAVNVDINQGVEVLHAVIDETFDSPVPWAVLAKERAKTILARVSRSEDNAEEVFTALKDAHDLHRDSLVKMGATTYAVLDFKANGGADETLFQLAPHGDEFKITWPAFFGERFFAAAMNVAQALREADREPGFSDFLAFHVAYRKILDSNLIEAQEATRFLGTVGFRPHSQTYVSLTDPGLGHIFGTTRHSRWMTGAIIHNEYLERPTGVPRSDMDSYRIPDIGDFACVRLHVGAQAPTTVYIGRFPHTGDSHNFDNEFTASTNTIKATLTTFFNLGAAECKISMEGLTTSQMLRYMQMLGSVSRRRLQYLSAAFNINPANKSVTDDVDVQHPVLLKKPMEICLRGIQLAAQGGFDKVTFDGADDRYPSVPFVQQMLFADLLKLVHEAHSVGLITYMSAGFTFKNIKDAVYTGVDGIGLGGAQILRHMDKQTGMHGPYTEENIDRIKVEREDAEKSLRGRGALLLARLDQMYFEGSSTEQENALRLPLYDALLNINIAEIQRILSEEPAAGDVVAIFDDSEQPYVGRARRILRSEAPLVRKGAKSDEVWTKFVAMLGRYVKAKNEAALQEKYRDDMWTDLRCSYREAMGDQKKRTSSTNTNHTNLAQVLDPDFDTAHTPTPSAGGTSRCATVQWRHALAIPHAAVKQLYDGHEDLRREHTPKAVLVPRYL
ncbi:hypothetical protein C8R45DRAFT_1072436 [Mycena sanguinolenta]|nr:hypothetical protein C8R45DRAFT_1072436 [Mycena sanguinolenta]